MTIEQLRRAYEATPFQPFILHLADDRALPVMSREFIATYPSGRTVFVVQPDESWNIIDLLLVTDLEFRPSPDGSRRRGRR